MIVDIADNPVPTSSTTRLTTAGLRAGLLSLAALFFVAHAACMPTTLGDVDSINFAFGVQEFDVARHQPHPPGYPVFIGLAKVSTALVNAIGVASPEVRGLSLLSAIAGAILILLLFQLYSFLIADRVAALWAVVVTALAPLLWFNALRPLSDVTGLTAAVAAQVFLVAVLSKNVTPERTARWLTLGALLAGVAIGVRSQNFLLTLPLLGLALLQPRSSLRERHRLLALAMAIAGALLWAVPMLIVSGGLESYLQALRNQAGEDFSGVVMLWTSRSPRAAADALAYSLLWPWGSLAAGGVVLALAAVGAGRMLVRAPLALVIVFVGFAPYAVFHLLFHETVTTRYALPLVVATALLMVYALAGMGRLMLHVGGVVLVIWSFAVTAPAAREYSTRASPAARALQDASLTPGTVTAMHAVFLRSQQWYQRAGAGPSVRRLHGREISGLVDLWRRQPEASVVFLADPRRTDLAMLDPRQRSLIRSYDWGFAEFPLLGGVRPNGVHLFRLQPPGWMLGDGWAVTAEVGGQTARRGTGPMRQPVIAWVRSRPGAATVMIGGRDIGAAAARVSIGFGELRHGFEAKPGFFFETFSLPAGSLESAEKYIPFEVTAAPEAGGSTQVHLEQFDLQSDGVPMVGALAGWHEPELNPSTGRAWRWMSERATLWVRPVGRDVKVRLTGESPLRYFSAAPTLLATVAGQIVGRLTPSDDFMWELTIPTSLLAGRHELVIQSDSSFVPGNGDARNLAVRIYSIDVN